MTKKVLLAAFAAAAIAVPAIAGDCASGFSCNNECPLAQAANTRRSTGNEAAAFRTLAAAQVQRNLARI
jgi:hypothetical protein